MLVDRAGLVEVGDDASGGASLSTCRPARWSAPCQRGAVDLKLDEGREMPGLLLECPTHVGGDSDRVELTSGSQPQEPTSIGAPVPACIRQASAEW